MKRMVLCVVLIAAMIILSLSGFVYIDKTAQEMRSGIDRIEKAYLQEDAEVMKTEIDALKERWERFCNVHIFITDTDHALQITELLARIDGLSRTGNDELLSECAAADRLIETYRSEQVPGILNIL